MVPILSLQHNVMVFIAEFFWWFETVKPEFVQPRTEEFKDGEHHLLFIWFSWGLGGCVCCNQ